MWRSRVSQVGPDSENPTRERGHQLTEQSEVWMSNEAKLLHLQMIQANITRFSNNSFLLKGWSVALVSAVLLLDVGKAVFPYVLVLYIPLVMLAFMDGYYLFQEKKYRTLYREITKESFTDFRMSIEKHSVSRLSPLKSPSVWVFHGAFFVAITIVVCFSVNNIGGNDAKTKGIFQFSFQERLSSSFDGSKHGRSNR